MSPTEKRSGFPFPPHHRKLWLLALPPPARLHQGYRVATCGWGKRRLQCQTCHAKFKGAVDLQPNYSTFHKENMMKYDDSPGTARHLRWFLGIFMNWFFNYSTKILTRNHGVHQRIHGVPANLSTQMGIGPLGMWLTSPTHVAKR